MRQSSHSLAAIGEGEVVLFLLCKSENDFFGHNFACDCSRSPWSSFVWVKEKESEQINEGINERMRKMKKEKRKRILKLLFIKSAHENDFGSHKKLGNPLKSFSLFYTRERTSFSPKPHSQRIFCLPFILILLLHLSVGPKAILVSFTPTLTHSMGQIDKGSF